MSSFWLGLASGVPLMIAIGPIAVLLVEIGVERGARRAWPAAAGVATADLTYATVAALSGAAVQRALRPYTVPMQWTAAALLVALAAAMLRRSVRELRAAPLAEIASQHEHPAHDGVRLWAQLAALTLMNPLTIVAFTSLVVATGERASNAGWPLGIATASFGVHLVLVLLGSSVRKALPPLGPSWLRLVGGLLIAGLAVNLVSR